MRLAWSADETLAVALILGDPERLGALEHSREPALDRLRHDSGLPNVAAAGIVFDELAAWLDREAQAAHLVTLTGKPVGLYPATRRLPG